MGRSKRNFLAVFLTVGAFYLWACGAVALALPEGEKVVAGEASFDRSLPNTLNINTPSSRLITEYNRFSIAQQESVRFHQPSSEAVALNRVTGIDPSSILGSLSANGKIFLVNPNGVVFSPSSKVDVAGLAASTLDISNQDFLAGNYIFTKFPDKAGGSIINQGNIKAQEGGFVALLAQAVDNQGVIEAALGTVALASGEKVTLGLDGAGLVEVVVDEPLRAGVFGAGAQPLLEAVGNSGRLSAPGGKVLLTAKALNSVFDYTINNSGIIEAALLVNNAGVVELVSAGGAVANSGVISGSNISILNDDKVATSGRLAAEFNIWLDSQSADFSGWIESGQGTFNMNDGDTTLSGIFSGNKTFDDNGNITVTGNLIINNGDLIVRADKDNAGGGDFFQNPGTTIAAAGLGRKILIRSGSGKNNGTGNVTVGTISTVGDLEITAHGGYIRRNEDTTGIFGNRLTLLAQSMGLLDAPLLTDIDELREATAASPAGGIFINERRGLDIRSLRPSGAQTIINNLEGDLLTVNSIDTEGGSLTLTSAGDLIAGNSGGDDIIGGQGDLSLIADSDADGAGSFIQRQGTLISTGGNLTLQGADLSFSRLEAGGDVFLRPGAGGTTIGLGGGEGSFNLTQEELDRILFGGSMSIGSAFSGDMNIGQLDFSGRALDLISGAGIEGEAGVINVIADNLGLSAVSGIGSVSGLMISAADLSVSNSDSGDVRITDEGDLTAVSLVNNAPGGALNLSVDDNLYVQQIRSDDVRLASAFGSIIGLDNGLDDFGDLFPNIRGANTTLNAARGSIFGAYQEGEDSGYLLTDTSFVEAQAQELIKLWDVGSDHPVAFNNVTVTGGFGSVDLVTTSDMQVGAILGPVEVRLESLEGSIIGLDNGFDEESDNPIPNIQAPLLTLRADNSSISGAYLSGEAPGYLVTKIETLDARAQNQIKVWDIGSAEWIEFWWGGGFLNTLPVVLDSVLVAGGSGSVDIVTAYDLWAGFISDPVDVRLESRGGSIFGLFNGWDESANPIPNVRTSALTLRADNGGISGSHEPWYLLTQIGSLDAEARDFVKVWDAGTEAWNEDLGAFAGSPVALNNVVNQGWSFDGIDIVTTFDMEVGFVSDPFAARLESRFGSIAGQNLNNAAPADINTYWLSLFAGDSIYGNYEADVFYHNNTHDFLTTTADVIEASAGGSIDIYNTVSVFLGTIEAAGSGSIDIVADGGIDFSFIRNPRGVTLEALNGSIVGQRFGLSDIETGHLSLFASDAIYGFGSGYLVTQIDSLDARAGNLIRIKDIGRRVFADLDGDGMELEWILLNHPVTVTSAVVTGFNAASVEIITDADLRVGFISDPTDVSLTSIFGAIEDANGDELNIVSGVLVLSANSGIGSRDGDALETKVAYLTAFNGSSGDINIINNNPAGVTIFGDVFGYGLVNASGAINLSGSSSIMVDAAVIATGSIRLTALDTASGVQDGNLLANANIISTGGDVELSAEHDIIQNTAKIRAKNNVTLNADSDHNGQGDFRQDFGAVKNNDTGDIIIHGSDVLVRSVKSARDIIITAENNLTIAEPNVIPEEEYEEVVLGTNDFLGVAGESLELNWQAGAFTEFRLPFDFTYYGETYDRIFVSNKGIITFGSGSVDGFNSTDFLALIGAAPADWWDFSLLPTIAPLWGDWNTFNFSFTGDVYSFTPENDSFIAFRWEVQRPAANGIFPWNAPANFETVLYPSGAIKFNYGDIDSNLSGPGQEATVGISQADFFHYTLSSRNGVEASGLNNANSIIYSPADTSTYVLNAAGKVNLTAQNGAIIHDNDSGLKDIVAAEINLNAGNGIGSGSAVTTSTPLISALNTSGGDIVLVNEGDLRLLSVVNSAPGGNVNISVNSDLYISEIRADNINLTANSGSIIGLDNGLDESGGLIPNIQSLRTTLEAAAGSIFGAYQAADSEGYLLTGTGFVDAQAQELIKLWDIGNSPVTLNNISVSGGTGSLDVVTTSDMLVGTVSDPLEVSLQSLQGDIIDNNAGSENIVTENLILSAATGIGNQNALETVVSALSARVTGNGSAGNIEIGNSGDLSLSDLAGWGFAVKNFGSGSIAIGVHSNLIVDGAVVSGGDINFQADDYFLTGANTISSDSGNITLANSSAGRAISLGVASEADDLEIDDDEFGRLFAPLNLVIGSDNAGPITVDTVERGVGGLSLLSADMILDRGIGLGPQVSADTLNLFAGAGIGSETNPLDINVNTLSAQTTGIGAGIYLEEADGLGIQSLVSGGPASVLAHGSSTLGSITTAEDFNFTTSTGAVSVLSGTIESLSAGVNLTAQDGSIVALGAGPHLIAAGDSLLSASGIIASLAAPFDVSLSAGDLRLYIGDALGGVSGVFTGGLSEDGLLYNAAPPGLVYLNGLQIWPVLPAPVQPQPVEPPQIPPQPVEPPQIPPQTLEPPQIPPQPVEPPQILQQDPATGQPLFSDNALPEAGLLDSSGYILGQSSNSLVFRYLLGYLEQLANYQVNAFHLGGPVYFYHPLTEIEMAAFQELENIDDEFLKGALDIVGHEGLLPLLENQPQDGGPCFPGDPNCKK